MSETLMTREDVDTFEMLSAQLFSIYEEISALSKKNPNDGVNKFKLRFINKTLAKCNAYLDPKYRPYDDFETFDQDDIPQNGDVVLILSQYITCFEQLRADNVVRHSGTWCWRVLGHELDNVDSNGMVYIQTVMPKRLRD